MSTKTFFLEDTGLGHAKDENGMILRDCIESEFGMDPRDDIWAPIYVRLDTQEKMTWEEAPDGATRLDTQKDYGGAFTGPDGFCFIAKCPGGHTWIVDSPCSNCTRKGEKHQCWCRHGEPRQCNITVDKNCNTCSAGAGSIAVGNYHGFLQNGIFT